jgi:FkbM family methyltransferase
VISVWKPWYVYRPRQLVRRAARSLAAPPECATVRLPWGVELAVDPRETIGRALWTTGVYDIAVSELLYRLTPPGAVAVDAGANVGYMTGLLAVRAGPGGVVYAFEPHPTVADQLRENAARIARHPSAARVVVCAAALSDAPGEVRLVQPDGFAANHGLGRVGDGPAGIPVEARRLDDAVPEGRIDVLKIDVEGHEPAVLAGAEGLLRGGQVRHVVFEEHGGPDGPTGRRLGAAGYALFQVGWRLGGLVLARPDAPPVCRPYEAPSYLATLDPAGAAAACRPGGWRLFG